MKFMMGFLRRVPVASLLLLFLPDIMISQENPDQKYVYEEYADQFLEQDESYLASAEEWRDMIDQWLEKPLSINNEEADWLMEYKLISLYQLNKLKEYRLIYGDLLSLHELMYIDGWDLHTASKVMPLVTSIKSGNYNAIKKFEFSSVRQEIMLKTSFNTQKSKGYERTPTNENPGGDPVYTGSPVRLALRYDMEYRDRLSVGIRMKKDPGEPMFMPAGSSPLQGIKTPDLLSGYLCLKRIGPVQSIIIGNYRATFGYGITFGGGQYGMNSSNGMPGMAHRIKPQTSVSESGFFRGVAFSAGSGRFSLTGFASVKEIDGNSVVTDSLTGRPISFSSISTSGLHRTIDELNKRKSINEKLFGAYLVYHNNWLKTGVIAIYNRFNATVAKSDRTYAKFGLSGNDNFVAGISATAWLSKIQLFNETSVSRNLGLAMINGIQLIPFPGTSVFITHRNFAADYQNWYGAATSSSGQNAGERGLQFSFRTELPEDWLIEFTTDISRSLWVSYTLAAPSRQSELRFMALKTWQQSRSIVFTFRYINEAVNHPDQSNWICHPGELSSYRFRLEGKIDAGSGIRLKSRAECNLIQNKTPGWLIFQDIEFHPARSKTKLWLRSCFFDAPYFGNRIYAYENDVLYDFTSFMYYGKGVRGIMMITFCPLDWLDFWLRLSTVYYTNKKIGSGPDEIDGNRQNEIEFQVRIKVAG